MRENHGVGQMGLPIAVRFRLLTVRPCLFVSLNAPNLRRVSLTVGYLKYSPNTTDNEKQ